MRERATVDSSYRRVESKLEHLRTYSVDDIKISAEDFRREYCTIPIYTKRAQWYACQKAAELDSKIKILEEDKVRILVQKGTPENIARRVIAGDVRVGDDQMLALESGKLKGIRQLQSASSLNARIEFEDGRVIYTRNGKVTSVTW